MKQLIYISGPYSAPTVNQCEENTMKVIDIALEIHNKGHLAFVPHLSHWHDLRAKSKGVIISWDYWMDIDLRLIKACDALFYVASSKGADLELEFAKTLGLPIYYSLDEIPAGGD
jgi:hypothetical protein